MKNNFLDADKRRLRQDKQTSGRSIPPFRRDVLTASGKSNWKFYFQIAFFLRRQAAE